MARVRIATEDVFQLRRASIEAALDAALQIGNGSDFYTKVDMRNPSRTHWVRYRDYDISLKAIVACALRMTKPNLQAKDFHAADGAAHLRNLGFDVLHGAPKKPF